MVLESINIGSPLQIGLLIMLGFIPSIVWLLLFLKEDSDHPEPKYLISKTFLFGIMVAPIVVFFQWLSCDLLTGVAHVNECNELPQNFSLVFLGFAAFIEEYFKYWVVKVTVLNKADFDEPIDAMIYMITVAVGFAAIENILVLFNVVPNGIEQTVSTWVLRFTGATLLHVLASAIIGYFLAISWFWHNHRKKLLALGILVATLLHLGFNVSILNGNYLGGNLLGLMIIGIFVLIFFHRLKLFTPSKQTSET